MFEAIENNNFNIQLSLSGNPFPGDDTLMWTFNGMPLSAGGPINFTLDSISFSPITRNNSGTYTVTSSNVVDSATFQFEVMVFCKKATVKYGDPAYSTMFGNGGQVEQTGHWGGRRNVDYLCIIYLFTYFWWGGVDHMGWGIYATTNFNMITGLPLKNQEQVQTNTTS